MIVRVVIAESTRAFDRPYDYLVPEHLTERIAVGQLVSVPFANRKQGTRAYVIEIPDEEKSAADDAGVKAGKQKTLKMIDKVVEEVPLVGREQLILAREMRRRYFTSFGKALDTMVPPRIIDVGDKKVRHASLIDEDEALELLENNALTSQGQIRVTELLLDFEQLPVTEIRSACDVSESVIQTLKKKGVIRLFSARTKREIEVFEPVSRDEAPALRAAQKKAVQALTQAFLARERGRLAEFLLYGVTGSGKTEVYLQLAAQVLKAGSSVLILVPEIALTPQMIGRIAARFGDDVAIMHSRLTLTERYEMWQRVRRGETKIVVGARSAIFAPLEDLGLIVLDEEQEATYKSQINPRYHAREIARMRAMLNGAVLVLGSATPSVESYERTRRGDSTLLTLPDRIGTAGRANVQLVDMRPEYAAGHKLISRPLEDALSVALQRGEQAMILLNRRGFDPITVCTNCGLSLKCGSCDAALARHLNVHRPSAELRLLCHHCDRIYRLPNCCPSCGEASLRQMGAGTQQVEHALKARFPDARLLRMDQDTTSRRDAHRAILEQFSAGKADILIGTQMIAKGHDFSNVTVVGVIAADHLLNAGDFRASEQGFSLITQAAGRAGRGELPGDVFVQAFYLDSAPLLAAVNQDYKAFYRDEIAIRKRLSYPPFGHIGVVITSGLNEVKTKKALESFASVAFRAQRLDKKYADVSISPIAPAPIRRIRNRYRYRLILKSGDVEALTSLMADVDDALAKIPDVARTLDINPWSML